MIKLSYENLTSYIRIVAYWLSGVLVTAGVGGTGALSKEAIAGYIVAVVTFAWTLWGQRVVAKINEVAKMEIVKVIQITPTAEGKALVESVKTNPDAAASIAVSKT